MAAASSEVWSCINEPFAGSTMWWSARTSPEGLWATGPRVRLSSDEHRVHLVPAWDSQTQLFGESKPVRYNQRFVRQE